jgi:hypothetical protein
MLLLASVVVTGDPATTKTSFISAATGAQPAMLQLLPTHTASFCNIWENPSAETVAYFTAEMQSRRYLPYFPSQLCVGALHCSPSDLVFFCEDEAIGNGAHTCDDELVKTEAQNALVQLTEVGGDLLDRLVACPAGVGGGSGDGEACDLSKPAEFAVELLRCAARAGAVAYFVHQDRLEVGGSLCSAHVEHTTQRLSFIASLSDGPLSIFVFVVPVAGSDGEQTSRTLEKELRGSRLRSTSRLFLAVEPLPVPVGTRQWTPPVAATLLQRLCRLCAHVTTGTSGSLGPLLAFKLRQTLRCSSLAASLGFAEFQPADVPRECMMAILGSLGHGCEARIACDKPPTLEELFANVIAVPPLVLLDHVMASN